RYCARNPASTSEWARPDEAASAPRQVVRERLRHATRVPLQRAVLEVGERPARLVDFGSEPRQLFVKGLGGHVRPPDPAGSVEAVTARLHDVLLLERRALGPQPGGPLGS